MYLFLIKASIDEDSQKVEKQKVMYIEIKKSKETKGSPKFTHSGMVFNIRQGEMCNRGWEGMSGPGEERNLLWGN